MKEYAAEYFGVEFHNYRHAMCVMPGYQILTVLLLLALLRFWLAVEHLL